KDDVDIKYKTKKGKIIKVADRVCKKLESALEKVYEIDSDLNVIDINDGSRIRTNKKSLTFYSNSRRSPTPSATLG
ncbi:hypothetical protein, partial [Tamilnaduibacter salinus]|uniref:hypothetical protein n=1 Tax=Tamilnaduibacter salinus TaxID=1484056 RepID=UPI001D17363B